MMNTKGEMIAGEGQKKLLTIIDQFRELNLGQDISLPQLVVVGDQSSGKSSLLQSLTELPFPVASELCTRHATQVVFSRSSGDDRRTVVSITPSDGCSPERRAELEKFTFSVEILEENIFAEILDKAAQTMGLPKANEPVENLAVRFSDDVLKIELNGPNNPHLSFIDIPGIFHNPTEYQTMDDRRLILNLIEKYIREPRTIIIAVMNATQNLALQEIFTLANRADPHGRRTVGVITKIDLVQEGDHAGAIKHAKNLVTKLQHGWFCVRNRSTAEIKNGVTPSQRLELEREVLNKAPWTELDRNHCGVPALKSYLETMLCEHLHNEFPGLKKQIHELLTQSRRELEHLGPSRTTITEQRSFMIALAAEYQKKVDDSLVGRHGIDSSPSTKLRTWICNLNQAFSSRLFAQGSTLQWRRTDDNAVNREGGISERDIESEHAVDPDIDDNEDIEGSEEISNLYEVIRSYYRNSRGTELPGLVNPQVLESLFRYQSSNWDKISAEHISNIQQRIRDCHRDHLQSTVVDHELRRKLQNLLESDMNDRLSSGPTELVKILEDERQGILQTNNHYYADNLASARAERVISQLKRIGFTDGCKYTMNFKHMSTAVSRSNEVGAIHDIHDTLYAYYKVARKRFCDVVTSQVIERNLVGKFGPLRVFTPAWIAQWDDEMLQEVAMENWDLRNRREELLARIERLEKALEVARDV